MTTRRVLLIEDEPNIREAMRFVLSRAGWEALLHGDGVTAQDAVRRHRPDVIVLDVMLPGRSGFDVLAALRADPATASLPILMLTARGREADRSHAVSLGATDFMSKPFSNAALVEAVEALGAGAPQGAEAPAAGRA